MPRSVVDVRYKVRPSARARITISNVPTAQIAAIDKLRALGRYRSRTDFVAQAITEKLCVDAFAGATR